MGSSTCTCRLLTTLLKLPSLTLHHNSLPLARQSLEATSTLVVPQKDCHPSRLGPRTCTVYVHALLMQVSMYRPIPPGLQDVGDGWGFDIQNCQLPHPGAGFHCQIPLYTPIYLCIRIIIKVIIVAIIINNNYNNYIHSLSGILFITMQLSLTQQIFHVGRVKLGIFLLGTARVLYLVRTLFASGLKRLGQGESIE